MRLLLSTRTRTSALTAISLTAPGRVARQRSFVLERRRAAQRAPVGTAAVRRTAPLNVTAVFVAVEAALRAIAAPAVKGLCATLKVSA